LKKLLYPFEAEETGLRLLFPRRFFNGDPEAEAQTSTLANSLRRIPLLTNSATNCCASARVRRLHADNLIFYGHPATSTQNRQVFGSLRTGVSVSVGQTLTFWERRVPKTDKTNSLALLPALAQALV